VRSPSRSPTREPGIESFPERDEVTNPRRAGTSARRKAESAVRRDSEVPVFTASRPWTRSAREEGSGSRSYGSGRESLRGGKDQEGIDLRAGLKNSFGGADSRREKTSGAESIPWALTGARFR
jgi:hypothetical protein